MPPYRIKGPGASTVMVFQPIYPDVSDGSRRLTYQPRRGRWKFYFRTRGPFVLKDSGAERKLMMTPLWVTNTGELWVNEEGRPLEFLDLS